jgi:hypothetical protein
MRTTKIMALSVASALTLAACGGADEDDTATVAGDIGASDESGMDMEDQILGNEMDADELSGRMTDGEVTRYRIDETGDDEVEVAVASPSPNMERMRAEPLTEEQEMRRASVDVEQVKRDTGTEARARVQERRPLYDPRWDGDASFAELDRNNDGRMSIAEFAIYDLANVNPTVKGSKDDEMMPYVSDDAINMVAVDFVRLDTDGDYFLSREEFLPATR